MGGGGGGLWPPATTEIPEIPEIPEMSETLEERRPKRKKERKRKPRMMEAILDVPRWTLVFIFTSRDSVNAPEMLGVGGGGVEDDENFGNS